MRRIAVALAALALGCAGCATGQTGDPTSVSHEGATISGDVISDAGGEVEYWVEFGTTTAYGSEGLHRTVSTQLNTPYNACHEYHDRERNG